MKETTDFIPAADQRRDFNKQLCALVKVQVVDEITDVEGNIMGDIVNKGVEKWVYMAKGSRNMKIHLKNNLPAKIMFRDYGINGLVSNRIYELVLKTTADTPSEERQTFILNYAPSNATVLIDSKLYNGKGRVETKLSVGEHRYIIAADGYVSVEGTVKLQSNAAREITENLKAESSSIPRKEDNTPTVVETPKVESGSKSSWSITNYTKDMIKGEGSFSYEDFYYIVISEEKHTVAVVRPIDDEYGEYSIPAQIQRNGTTYAVTEIAPNAFSKCKSMTNIVLPDTIEIINHEAFEGCKNLQRINFPTSVKYIGERAFMNCKNLRHVSFSSGLRSVRKYAFSGCRLEELILPNNLEELDDYAFYCSHYTSNSKERSLYIPNSTKKIGKRALGFLIRQGEDMTYRTCLIGLLPQ